MNTNQPGIVTEHQEAQFELAQESTQIPRIHWMMACSSDRTEHSFRFTARYDAGGRKSVASLDSVPQESADHAADSGFTPTPELLDQAHQFFIRNEAKHVSGERARYYGVLSQMQNSRHGAFGQPPTLPPSHGVFELSWNKGDPHTVFVRRLQSSN